MNLLHLILDKSVGPFSHLIIQQLFPYMDNLGIDYLDQWSEFNKLDPSHVWEMGLNLTKPEKMQSPVLLKIRIHMGPP